MVRWNKEVTYIHTFPYHRFFNFLRTAHNIEWGVLWVVHRSYMEFQRFLQSASKGKCEREEEKTIK